MNPELSDVQKGIFRATKEIAAPLNRAFRSGFVSFQSPTGDVGGLAVVLTPTEVSLEVGGVTVAEAASVVGAVNAGGRVIGFTPAEIQTLARMAESYESVTPEELPARLAVLEKVKRVTSL
jgi:hypothetical protein